MKKFFKIFGTFILASMIFTSTSQMGNGEAVVGLVITMVLCAFLIYKIWKKKDPTKVKPKKKSKKQERQDYLASQGITANVVLPHAAGLPIPEGVQCEISSYPNKIAIVGNGLEFNLDKERITDVCVKTDVEIQKQYVSSVGGAIGGAILFGGLGAVVGGRAKEKKSKTTTYYLIFTYTKDGDVNYASFETIAFNKQVDAFVKEFAAQPKKNTSIDL